MTRVAPVLRNLLAIIVVAGVCQSAIAQDNIMPRVSVVHPGAASLRNDLKSVLALTSAKDQKEWANIADFLEQFVGGVIESEPIRADFLVDRSDVPVVLSIPVDDIEVFRENIYVLGIESTPDRRDTSLYKLSESYTGFLRLLNGYATIGMERNDVAAQVLGKRKEAISDLLRRKFSLGAEVVNSALDEASRDQRRKKFEDIRHNLMAAIKKTPSESKAAFELRQAVVEGWMDEAERLLADTQRLTGGWTQSADAKSGKFTFDLKPIPDTDLAKTVMAFGQTPSMFAAVPRSENSILSLRVNHPLDEMRIRNLNRHWTLALPDAKERIERSKLSDAEKAAAAELAEHLLKLLGQGTDSGVIDCFVEVTPAAGGRHVMITGLKTPADCDLMKLVQLIPQAMSRQKLETNVAKFGDVDIHKLTVTSRFSEPLNSFFSAEGVVWLGTGPNGFWSATGPGSQEKLKAAIEAVSEKAEAAPSMTAIDLQMHLRPWLQLNDKLSKELAEPEDEAGKTLRKERNELRAQALEAMSDEDDGLTYRVSRVEDRAEGITEVGAGVLRLIGMLMAEFSRENLALE